MTVRSDSGRKWTYDDYVALPPDLLRHEIIGGEHHVNSAPSPYHQQIVACLLYQLHGTIAESGRGIVYPAPIDVHLSDHNVLQPDIVVVLGGDHVARRSSRIVQAPDLVIEVLSPSTRRNDLGIKRDVYARFGVGEYWIVDPEARAVEQLRHDGNAFALVEKARESITWSGPKVVVDLTKVWVARGALIEGTRHHSPERRGLRG